MSAVVAIIFCFSSCIYINIYFFRLVGIGKFDAMARNLSATIAVGEVEAATAITTLFLGVEVQIRRQVPVNAWLEN